MTHQEAVVTVYAFRSYSPMVECPRMSVYKATLTAIRAMGSEPLPATAETVPGELVDEDGCYRRQPTGWGDLA